VLVAYATLCTVTGWGYVLEKSSKLIDAVHAVLMLLAGVAGAVLGTAILYGALKSTQNMAAGVFLVAGAVLLIAGGPFFVCVDSECYMGCEARPVPSRPNKALQPTCSLHEHAAELRR
jgi:hypothetical protein